MTQNATKENAPCREHNLSADGHGAPRHGNAVAPDDSLERIIGDTDLMVPLFKCGTWLPCNIGKGDKRFDHRVRISSMAKSGLALKTRRTKFFACARLPVPLFVTAYPASGRSFDLCLLPHICHFPEQDKHRRSLFLLLLLTEQVS